VISVDKILKATFCVLYREMKVCLKTVLHLCCTLGKPVRETPTYPQEGCPQIFGPGYAKRSLAVIHRAYAQIPY
jgi:hypothetical protein